MNLKNRMWWNAKELVLYFVCLTSEGCIFLTKIVFVNSSPELKVRRFNFARASQPMPVVWYVTHSPVHDTLNDVAFFSFWGVLYWSGVEAAVTGYYDKLLQLYIKILKKFREILTALHREVQLAKRVLPPCGCCLETKKLSISSPLIRMITLTSRIWHNLYAQPRPNLSAEPQLIWQLKLVSLFSCFCCN